MKCCKIISTCFTPRHNRNRHQPSWTVTWPSHIQFGYDAHGVLSMLRDVIEIEKDVDAGVELDTIIVNSNVGFEEGNKYVKSLHGQKTLNGQIISITMDNIGGQFGAYDLAYSVLANKYDYWMLDEDDIIITGHHYYKTLIDRLDYDESCYALIGLVEHPHHPTVAGGALLLMKDHVPKLLTLKNGCLPHPEKNDYDSRVNEGEIAWSLKIFELKLKIVYKGKSKQNTSIDWDYETDYCLPYREMIEKFGSVEAFKQSTFYRGVGWDVLWRNADDSKT